jgi:rhodanese-related sulfurtransferase
MLPPARTENRQAHSAVVGTIPVLSLQAQLLRLLAVAFALAGVLVSVRGMPQFRAGTGDPNSEAGACAAPDSGGFHVQYITPDEAHALLGQPSVAFVDCRPRQDFEAGHVAGSVHVEAEASALGPTLVELARGAGTVVTYCDAQAECERSLRVATLLAQAGASDVRVLEGGMPAWLSQGFPAQSGACDDCEAHP